MFNDAQSDLSSTKIRPQHIDMSYFEGDRGIKVEYEEIYIFQESIIRFGFRSSFEGSNLQRPSLKNAGDCHENQTFEPESLGDCDDRR